MPRRVLLQPSGLDSRAAAEAEEQARFEAALAELAGARLRRRSTAPALTAPMRASRMRPRTR